MILSLIETTKQEVVKSLGKQTIDNEWHTVAQELYDIKIVMKKYALMEKELKKKLIILSDEQSVYDFMYLFECRERKGTLDYVKIIKDYNVDSEKYRKKPISTWSLNKL